jgi:photosystem II stability/assembly factor-like uncharacterized protein
MNKVYLLFASVLFSITVSYSQWSVISNQGNEAVSFPSSDTGYSTANGITKKTINGGFNWSSLSGGNLTGIYFINNITGWVVGYPGYIGRTTNGSSFTQQQTGVQDRLNDVFFINDNTGWVVGGDFSVERIFKTTNAGVNWTAQTSGTPNKLFSVYFVNENTGWSVGGPSSPKIIKTTNGGGNWFTQPTSITTPLYSVMFSGPDTGWAVAGYIGGETIIKTTNGGLSWFSQSSEDNRYLRDCWVKNPLTAFAVGQSGKLIYTVNGGDNWIVQSTGSTVELWSIGFANDSVGYAIGSTVVLKTTNGGITFVNNSSNSAPEKFVLHQNYPNPFNPETEISYELKTAGYIVIDIFDASGQKAASLVNMKQKAGRHEIRWNASSFPSGVYFCRLQTEGFCQSKKMVLLK